MINKKRTKKLRSSKSSSTQISKRPGRRKKKILGYPSKLAKRKLKKAKRQFSFSEEFPLKTRIKVIGIGGGGGSIVSEIAKSLKKVSFVVADTDIRALKKNSGIKHFYFGRDLTHGLGTGMNPELARESAEKEKEKIAKIFEGQDIVILVASLGGGVGSGATSVFAEIARNSGSITLGFFTLPFKFEGWKKSKIANNSLQSLRDALSVSINIANERIFKIINEKTSITEAFSVVNKNLIRSLESLIDTIYEPGLINIDFADIRTILKGKGKLAFLNTYQARGKKGAEEIVKNIFNNPLYSYNLIAEKILFNISGGSNLSMVDVEKISKSISNLNPKAKIIFGISRSSKSKDKIKATLLVTGTSRFAQSRPSGSSDNIKKEEVRKEEVRKEEVRKEEVEKKEVKKESKKTSVLPSKVLHQKSTITGRRHKERSVEGYHSIDHKIGKPRTFSEGKVRGEGDRTSSVSKKQKDGVKPISIKSKIKPSHQKFNKEDIISKTTFIKTPDSSSETPFKKEPNATSYQSLVKGVRGRQKTIRPTPPAGERQPADKEKTKIRRNALEIKKAEEIEESKKWAQEKEWEIPAFLRRIKE